VAAKAGNRMKGCGEWEDRTPRPLTVVPLLTLPLVGNLSLQNTPFYEHNLSKPTKKAEGGDMTRKWGGGSNRNDDSKKSPPSVFITVDNV